MKARIFSSNHQVMYEVEASSWKGLHDSISEIFNSFIPLEKCGLCGSADLISVRRGRRDHEHRGLECLNCHAALTFGSRQADGGLFPIRFDQFHRPLPKQGWRLRAAAADSGESEEETS